MSEGSSDQQKHQPVTAKEDFHASKGEQIHFSESNLSPIEHYFLGSTTKPIGGVYYDAAIIRSMISMAKESPEEMAGVEAILLTPEDVENGVRTKEEVEKERIKANEKLLYVGNYTIFSAETVKLGTDRENREKNVDIFLKFGGLDQHGEIGKEWEIELRKVIDPSIIVDDAKLWEKVAIRPKGKDMFGEDDPGEEDLFTIQERDGKHYLRFIGLDVENKKMAA